MKRFLILLTPVIVALLAFVAFQYGSNRNIDDNTGALPSRTVNFFHYFSGPLRGGIDGMVETVNRNSPDYTVLASGLDHEAFKTMIITSLDGGNPPELFSYWAGERVRQLVSKQQLLPIDAFWEKEKLSDHFSPALVESAVTYDGRKYLLPITQHIVVFFYNKRIFDNQGLTPPRSWPEFLHVCDTLQRSGITPITLGARERWPAQFWFDYLLLRTAGPDYRQRLMRGDAAYTDAEVVTVYRIWSELLQHGYFHPNANHLDWAEATDMVRQGKAAMTLMGTWATQILEKAPDGLEAGMGYDFFPFPKMEQGVPLVAVGPIDGIIISRSSENHDFAEEVLTYFAGRKAQEIMSTGSGALAPNRSVPDSFYSPFKLRLKQEIDRCDRWAFNYDLATPGDIADRGMDSFNELIEFPGQYQQILIDLHNDVTAAVQVK